MEEAQRTVTLEVSPQDLELIKAGLDLLLMTEDDREAVTELKLLIERLGEELPAHAIGRS